MSEIKHKTIKRLFFTLWAIITLTALVIVVFLAYKIMNENSNLIKSVINPPNQPVSQNSSPQPQLQSRSVHVYVVSRDDMCLHPLEIQIEWKNTYQENCKQLIKAMKEIQGETYILPIPYDVNLRGVYLTPEGRLIIDLPALIISRYEKNLSALFETLITYSLVDSFLQKELTENTPVKEVQFLIEGAVPTSEFPYHISWSQPFSPDYSLVCSD